MRYLHATFKNYIGFFNGMGLEEVSIDFSKCQHNITIIIGANGSGKSTLMKHLNVFPDGSSSFIPNKSAEKHLVLNADGDIYDIRILSPADLKSRKTTKAYISKNGVELNENGNVSSYKDIIFSEFDLDSNYMSLSRLSNTDRGLGDKTPAERKRFTANIIDNLEVYNSMYKSFNKKSLVYKSHLNTLHTKIQNIGSKDILEQKLKDLRSRESYLNSQIVATNNKIVAIQAKYSIDEDEAKAIQDANDKYNEIFNEVSNISSQLDTYYNKTKIRREDIKSSYESDSNLEKEYTSKVNELSSLWKDKNNRLAEVTNNILSLKAELQNIDTDDNVSGNYNDSNNKIKELKDTLKSLNVSEDEDIINLTNFLSSMEKLITMIDKFSDNLTSDDIKFIVSNDINTFIKETMDTQNSVITDIEVKKQELAELQSKIKVLAVLENRPAKCKIDSCPFISDSIKLKKSINTNIDEELSKLQEEIMSMSNKVTEYQSKIDYASSLTSKHMELGAIRQLISENIVYLDKYFPNFVNKFETNLINLHMFNEIRDLSHLVDGLNLLKILNSEIQNNKILEVEYNNYQEKIQLLNSSKSMFSKLEAEEQELIESTSKIKADIDNYNKTLSEVSSRLSNESVYYSIYENYIIKNNELENAKKIVDNYKSKSNKALDELSTISSFKDEIDKMSAELQPIMQDISVVSGQLTLLDSYYDEYNEYKSSYDIIETLKKYCSPTGGGIQTLFMQIYMSKTKDISNEVLSMLFNGNYQLQDFIINENEFRIPFIGEGLPVDDISSGSSSQVAMMSMIINLVLLHQGSTKFNIAQLDEMDDSLDNYNRSIFVNILFHCIKILEIEQLFIISHSLEADNTFADVIKLKQYENYESSLSGGNVIWDYNEIIKS